MHKPHRHNAETHPLRRRRQEDKINNHVAVAKNVAFLEAASLDTMDLTNSDAEGKDPSDEAAVVGHVPAEHDLACVAAHSSPTDTAAPTPPAHADQTSTLTHVQGKGPDGSLKDTIWARTSMPKHLQTTPAAVFIILDKCYKNNICRGTILTRIRSTIQTLSEDAAVVEPIPIIVATSNYEECRRWEKACYNTDELFHFCGAEQLVGQPLAHNDVTWNILVASNSPHRTPIRNEAFKRLPSNQGLRGLFVRMGTTTTCYSPRVDHKLALCWDLIDRFVHTEGNIWEWIVREEAPSDLGLMSALNNHTHTYVLDWEHTSAHCASKKIKGNIALIQHVKAAQYACQNNDMLLPKGRVQLSYALLAKYAHRDNVLAYIRQVRKLTQTSPIQKNEPVFTIKEGRMFAKKDILSNEYITDMKGALVLHNEFRISKSTLNVTIGVPKYPSTDAFCFLVDDNCPVNSLLVADANGANVRIYTKQAEPGWMEYVLVSTKPIKKVTTRT
jgi:hypothetical protein